VRGDFKNDFDLHHYPFDRQTITVRLFNARAASDRIVYVQDRRSINVAGGRATLDEAASASGGAGPEAMLMSTKPKAAITVEPSHWLLFAI